MKIEIIDPSTNELIETYSVPHLNMLDFQEWKGNEEIILHLKCLKQVVKNLDSKDPETNEPISDPHLVDFYLPDPTKNQVISRFAKSRTGIGEVQDQNFDEVTEKVSMPKLKSSTVLFAVVTEILQNHSHPDFRVRIIDE